jgi:hypothetical protein
VVLLDNREHQAEVVQVDLVHLIVSDPAEVALEVRHLRPAVLPEELLEELPEVQVGVGLVLARVAVAIPRAPLVAPVASHHEVENQSVQSDKSLTTWKHPQWVECACRVATAT